MNILRRTKHAIAGYKRRVGRRWAPVTFLDAFELLKQQGYRDHAEFIVIVVQRRLQFRVAHGGRVDTLGISPGDTLTVATPPDGKPLSLGINVTVPGTT
jgi:hypothetical protein